MPRRLTLVALVWVGLVAAGCPDNEPPVPPETDGGDSGAFDAGFDAGDPDYACDLTEQDCDAGASCVRYATATGKLGAQCLPGDCDVVAQDCAPGEDGGQKCTYVTDAGLSFRSCVEDGTALEGEPCVPTPTSNNCAAGLICVPRSQADGGTRQVCMKFCNSSADCRLGEKCLLMLDLSPALERPFVCDVACDVLAQDCQPSEACYPTDVAPACYPDPGTTEVGGACGRSSDCVRGAVCVRDVCAQLCAFPEGAPSCASGRCTSITMPGQLDAGACL